MTKTLEISDETQAVVYALRRLGYKTTKPRHKNANGADLYAIQSDYVLSVEIKSAKPGNSHRVLRVRAVEHNRQNDDLIAIVFPSKYVLIEPMRDHLKCCNKQGDRFLNY